MKKGLLYRVFVNNIFYIFNLVAAISAFVVSVRTGVISSIFIVISLLIFGFNRRYIKYNQLFFAYAIFCLISGIWYFFNHLSFNLFAAGISYNFIPSLLFVIGNNIEKDEMDSILDSIFFSNLIIIGIGLAVYTFNKSYYFSVMDTEFATTYTYAHKFGSYLTCLVFGSMCVAQLGLTIYRIFNNRNIIVTLISMPVCLYALIISMERGAWLAAGVLIITVVIFLFHDKQYFKVAIRVIAIIIVALFVGMFLINNFLNENTYSYLLDRLGNMSNIFSSRSDQTDKAIEVFFNYPLGYGLGAAGNKAALIGSNRIIPDGNYLRILVEIGPIGFIIFIVLLIRGILYGLRSNITYKILAAILVAYAAHAVGSNVFDFFYSSYIFWLILGYLNNNSIQETSPLVSEDLD